MMDMLKNFIGSRKAVFVALLIIAATVFVIVGKMTIEQWQEFATWVGGVWVAAQGVEDAVVKSAKVKMDGAVKVHVAANMIDAVALEDEE